MVFEKRRKWNSVVTNRGVATEGRRRNTDEEKCLSFIDPTKA
jgi:hypothetical protein